MPDMLVKLYDLPDISPLLLQLKKESIVIRKAAAYEKHLVVDWVNNTFGANWGSECDIAFNNHPLTCYIATKKGHILGFACYECTCRNFFGPIGVLNSVRGKGVGKALLCSCLQSMYSLGYAYAIIGAAGSTSFFEKSVRATEIQGSSPGIYLDRLNG